MASATADDTSTTVSARFVSVSTRVLWPTALRTGLSRFVLAWAAYMAFAWLVLRVWPQPALHLPHGWAWVVSVYARQDAGHFARIAHYGYLSRGRDDVNVAYFPGYPLAARYLADVFGLGHTTALDYTAALALIAWTGSATAAVLLCRCAVMQTADTQLRSNTRTALVAVTIMLCGPCSLFFIASYSEGPFLALALAVWLCARSARWAPAGLLCAAAISVRVNGLFLLAGVLVLYVQHARRAGRPLAQASIVWLVLPALAVLAAYMAWLQIATGHWNAWLIAEQRGWRRDTNWPWNTLIVSVRHYQATAANPAAHYECGLELIFAGGYLAALVAVARRRWWPELTYVGLTVGALLTSSFYQSVPRSTTLCFPVLALAARSVIKRGAARRLVVALCWLVSLAILTTSAALYVRGYFAG